MSELKINHPTARIKSIDALRGLDMIFLVGISGVFQALGKSYDLIFPLFIFLVGVSMPFAITKRIEEGYSHKSLYIHIIRRSVLLFFLGLLFNGSLLGFNWSHFTFTGVLLVVEWLFVYFLYKQKIFLKV